VYVDIVCPDETSALAFRVKIVLNVSIKKPEIYCTAASTDLPSPSIYES
jgi:hypothetical protein